MIKPMNLLFLGITAFRKLNRSNGDITNEHFTDISSWTDADGGTGASTQETFDGKSCVKLTNGANAGASNYAYIYKDVGSFSGARTVFTVISYCDAIGTNADTDYFLCQFFNGSYTLQFILASDGLYIHNGTAPVEVGTDLVVQDVWQEWTFDVDWTNRLVDVYLNSVLKAADVSMDYASATDNGTVWLIQYGTTTANRITYLDLFLAGSTLL